MNDLANETFRPGWLRSVGPGWTNWAVESFMDEAAHKVGEDPVAFRLQHLTAKGANGGSAPNSVGGAKRMAGVLQRVADKAGWGKKLPANEGLGVAVTFGQERDMPTWTGVVAHVHVDPASGKVTLKKLNVVIDAGTIVHPDGALAQTEGAALWGASMALHEGTEFVNGQVRDVNLNSYQPMRRTWTSNLSTVTIKPLAWVNLQPPQWPRRLVTPYSMRLGRGFGSCRLPPMR